MRARVRRNRAFENLARMHQNRVERAVGNFLDANQFVPRVQQQHLQRLDAFQKILFAQQLDDIFRIVQHGRFVLQFARHFPRQRERRHERHRLVAPDAANFLQIRDRSLRQRLQAFRIFAKAVCRLRRRSRLSNPSAKGSRSIPRGSTRPRRAPRAVRAGARWRAGL